jgi:hypothetical protein
MIQVLSPRKTKRLSKQRSYAVEPMQGLVKDLFDLETYWMRGNANNRWLFAAMGVVVQRHQYQAWQEGRSTWAIKQAASVARGWSYGFVTGRHRAGLRGGPPELCSSYGFA